MCGNKEDADDIVQQTFTLAFTKISGFREQSGIYTWLYAIAKNLCLRLLENRHKSTFASLESLINTAQAQEGRDDYTAIEKQYYIAQVREGCLLGLLKCLGFYQRIAFILNVLLDVKTKDVSVILNKSEAAIRMLVHHAKQNIRNFLCKNCSLYDPANSCHCENLIGFSLKQGWIKANNDKTAFKADISASSVEKEISAIKKITALYKSLNGNGPSEHIIQLILKEINDPVYKIFSAEKVK